MLFCEFLVLRPSYFLEIPLGKKDQAKSNLSHAKISLAAEAMDRLDVTLRSRYSPWK